MANLIGSYSTFIDSGGNLSDAIMCCVYLCLISSFPIYYRLTPTYMAVILISVQLKRFFGEGPLWYSQYEDKLCEEHWWTNLLYINNFYPNSLGGEVNNICSRSSADQIFLYMCDILRHKTQ